MTGLHRRSEPAGGAILALPTGLQQRTATGGIDVRAAADADANTFEGYAVLFDVVDAYGTTFAPGLWTAGGLDGDLYALLAMHDPEQVVGTFTAREDTTGLWISGGWDDTQQGRDARARARSGSAPELSVGFVPIMVDPDDENRFTQARLVEVSQITRRMAAVPGAGFVAARGLPAGRPGDDPAAAADLAADAQRAAALLALSVRVAH